MRLYINNTEIKIEFSFVLIICTAMLFGNEALLWVLTFSALHELGHIALLYAVGGRVDVLTLAYYGIGIKHSSALSVNREIIFLLGGIAVNAVFAVIDIQREINFSLLLLNALPVYPLDGGRVLRLLLGEFISYSAVDKLLQIISFSAIILVISFAVICGNASLIFIAIYLFVYSVNNSF